MGWLEKKYQQCLCFSYMVHDGFSVFIWMKVNHALLNKALCQRTRGTGCLICSNIKKRTFWGKGWRGKGQAPVQQYFICDFMRSIYNGVRNTGNGYMGLNSGFVKAGSYFALPLNLAANLTSGGRAWLQSSQTWVQKELCSHVFIRVYSGNRSERRLKNYASKFI